MATTREINGPVGRWLDWRGLGPKWSQGAGVYMQSRVGSSSY